MAPNYALSAAWREEGEGERNAADPDVGDTDDWRRSYRVAERIHLTVR
jgi:hypothetical protein